MEINDSEGQACTSQESGNSQVADPSFVLPSETLGSLPVLVQGCFLDEPLKYLTETPFHRNVLKVVYFYTHYC
jgi:hypothetical protein